MNDCPPRPVPTDLVARFSELRRRSSVRALFFDADGVLQLIGTPWPEALAQGGGEEFSRRLLATEAPTLRGERRLLDFLTDLVDELGLEEQGIAPSDLMSVWFRATPDPQAWDVVRAAREAGFLTVLTTNQQWERCEWMESLGYSSLCDVSAYSCTVGACKPEAEYFQRVLAMVDCQPQEVLFIDDIATNCSAAEEQGIHSYCHPSDGGAACLAAGMIRSLEELAVSPS